jgi:hypothetical protein
VRALDGRPSAPSRFGDDLGDDTDSAGFGFSAVDKRHGRFLLATGEAAGVLSCEGGSRRPVGRSVDGR